MDDTKRLRPLVAADVALRLGLAKPWDVMAALQARGSVGHADVNEFLADLSRVARLGPDDLARLSAETERVLAAQAGDAGRALSQLGGPVASLAPGTAGAGSGALAPADQALRTVPEGRYRDFAPVGEGGMGIVYWALDTELNRQVAFKIVRPDVAVTGGAHTPATPLGAQPPRPDSPASRAFHELKTRFLQEAWVTGGLEHPGVVPVYELGQTERGIPYYTMRFVRGSRTLASALEEARAAGPQARMQLLEPFLKVCDTIGYAHSRGVIHRDLKPQNIALGEFGEVVVLDWGLAKMSDGADLAASRWQERIADYRANASLQTALGPLGTPGYMSPEAALGEIERIGPASDVYSLGVILFEILTGRLPFEFRTYGEYREQVSIERAPAALEVDPAAPQALSVLCERTLARSQALRPSDVSEVAAAIRTWQAQTAIASELEETLREARATLRAARYATGDERVQALDRVTSAGEQVLRRQPDHAEARNLCAHATELRASAIAARERASRRRVVRLAGVAALAAAMLVAVGTAFVINAQKKEAQRATAAAEEASAERTKETARADRESREAQAARARAEDERARADGQAQEALEARELAELRAREAQQEAARARAASDALAESYRRARALALAAAAQREAQANPTASLHLAIEALAAQEFPETMSAALAALISTFEKPMLDVGEGVVDVRFMKDGRRILTQGASGAVALWGDGGERLRTFPGLRIAPRDSRRIVTPARVGADGREVPAEYATIQVESTDPLLLLADESGVVTVGPRPAVATIWRFDGGTVTLDGHAGDVTNLSLDSSAHFIVTGDAQGTVRVWNAAGELLRKHLGKGQPPLALAVSPMGDWTAQIEGDGTVRLLPPVGVPISLPVKSRLLSPVPGGGPERLPTIQFLGADRVLIEAEGALVAFDRTGREAWRVGEGHARPTPYPVEALVGVSHVSERVTFEGDRGITSVTFDGKEAGTIRLGVDEHSHNCLLTDDGQQIVASLCGGIDFYSYDVSNGRARMVLPTPRGMESHRARLSADRTRLVMWARTDNEVRLFGRSLVADDLTGAGTATHVRPLADSRVLVWNSGSGSLGITDAPSGSSVRALATLPARPPSHDAQPQVAAAGERLVCALPIGPEYWEIRTFEGDREQYAAMALQAWCSPGADRLVLTLRQAPPPADAPSAAPAPACGAGGKACGGSPATMEPVRLIDHRGRRIATLPHPSRLEFSSDGGRFLCRDWEGGATLHDRDGAVVATFPAPSPPVRPPERRLSSGGGHVVLTFTDGSVRIWSEEDRQERTLPNAFTDGGSAMTPSTLGAEARAPGEPPTALFAFGGRRLVYRVLDGSTVLHDLTGRALATLCEAGHEVLLHEGLQGDVMLGLVRSTKSPERTEARMLWDLEGRATSLARGGGGPTQPGQASQDSGTILVRGVRDGVTLLNRDGTERCSIQGVGQFFGWSLSPDGRILVGGQSQDSHLETPSSFTTWAVWPLERGPLLEALRSKGARPLSEEERARHRHLLEPMR